MRLPLRLPVVLLALLGLPGCSLERAEIRIAWEPLEELNERLPDGVLVFAGEDPSIPLRAWHVRVDAPGADLVTRVVASNDLDGTETVAEFAHRTGALVAVNGGFFRMDQDSATHVGLLLVDGRLIEPPLRSVLRDEQRYYLARAALGVMDDGLLDIAWVSGREGVLYAWDEPPPNEPGAPGSAPKLDGLPVWDAVDAVAAGPTLLVGGEVRISTDAEVFFGSAIPEVHPRTAAGVMPGGELVLLVVDGRQRGNRGVDLVELAALMRDLGCVEALNLDGGGSSTLVVTGELVNRPLGGTEEREVMSALTVLAE